MFRSVGDNVSDVGRVGEAGTPEIQTETLPNGADCHLPLGNHRAEALRERDCRKVAVRGFVAVGVIDRKPTAILTPFDLSHGAGSCFEETEVADLTRRLADLVVKI